MDETHGEFQFTHPGRGATEDQEDPNGDNGVSIHAPREGCDEVFMRAARYVYRFQFTHPGRGATLV